MSLLTIGLNHTTAPVSIREQVAFTPEQIDRALGELITVNGVSEAAILSTCNRTEVYCHLIQGEETEIIHWLGAYHRLNEQDIQPFLYQYADHSAVRHALRVACGLDSLVLGEAQILGQFKSAYQHAYRAGTLGRQLTRLFQHAFWVAKQVRSDTAIGANAVSVASAAVGLAQQIFGELNTHTALLIGAGETIELVARHLKGNHIGALVVANRSPERAEILAQHFDARAVGLPELGEALPLADIVISSTASTLPVLGKGIVERALKQRKHRPIFMVDLAVPRDIEPEVAALQDVYLYTVDDLEAIIQDNRQSRLTAAQQADQIIELQVEHFMGWLRAQEAVGTICAYRTKAQRLRDDVLARTQRMLAQGKDPQEVLCFLAHTLTNKLIHDPTCAMTQASREGRTDLLACARLLLNLPDDKD